MTLGGELEVLQGCGREPLQLGRLILFSAWREVPGSSGTTTVQLEINGAPVSGTQLSWVPGDAAGTRKEVTISQAVARGDRASFRILQAEAGAEDLQAEVVYA